MTEVRIDALRESHRAWLRPLKVLDRPWLVLGSAPDPTLPEGLVARCARLDINNAGRLAELRGLPPADLTFRSKTRAWSEHPTLHTRGLVWIHSEPLLLMRLRLLLKPKVRVGRLMRMSRHERDTMVKQVANASPEEAGGDIGKVTNGVAAVCYALLVGAPEVVIAGISLSKGGRSHDDLNWKRMQVTEDRFILQRLAAHANLSTTEPDLAEDTGIRLRD